MKLRIPKFKVEIVRPRKLYPIVLDDLIIKYIKFAVYTSPLAFWKLYELARPLLDRL